MKRQLQSGTIPSDPEITLEERTGTSETLPGVVPRRRTKRWPTGRVGHG